MTINSKAKITTVFIILVCLVFLALPVKYRITSWDCQGPVFRSYPPQCGSELTKVTTTHYITPIKLLAVSSRRHVSSAENGDFSEVINNPERYPTTVHVSPKDLIFRALAGFVVLGGILYVTVKRR